MLLNYYQLLCKNGHYWTIDQNVILRDFSKTSCPVCNEYPHWYNLVNFKKFCKKATKCKKESCLTCKSSKPQTVNLKKRCKEVCEHCGSKLQNIYEIPKKQGKLVKEKQLRRK